MPHTARVGTGSSPVPDLAFSTTAGLGALGRGWNASLPTLPAAPLRVRAQEPDAPGMLVAKVTPPERAFVLDYQANIGTDTPDLGYHYAPLDYVCTNVLVSNAVQGSGCGQRPAGERFTPIPAVWRGPA